MLKTQAAREDLAALDSVDDESRLETQRVILARCVEEEAQCAQVVEERRSRELLREQQRRAALAESVPLLPSNAPRPLDNIINKWQNYVDSIVSANDLPSGNMQPSRKRARRIALSPDPSPSDEVAKSPPSASSSSADVHIPSKRKRHSPPFPQTLPPPALYQVMLDYNSEILGYEPALAKMHLLWPNEADWKPLFNRLTELEPDEDATAVLGEVNDALASCTAAAAASHSNSDPDIDSVNGDNLKACQAQLRILSSRELSIMLETNQLPQKMTSIFVSGASKYMSDGDSDNVNQESLTLEHDLLTQLLGVSTGLHDGIFLVRCLVSYD